MLCQIKLLKQAPLFQSSKQASVNLRVVISEIWNLHMYPKAMSSGKVKAEKAIIRPNTTCVTECGNPIGYSWLISTQEQSTALLKPHRYSVQAEPEQDSFIVSSFPAELEGFPNGYELAYNRMNLPDESGSDDLRSEITFLRKSLCSLLLQPVGKPESCEQTRIQAVDALREGEPGLNAAGAEAEKQNVHEHTTEKVSDPTTSDLPMTAGHLEVQAVKEAAKEVQNSILSLKNIIENLPSQASHDHLTVLHKNIEGVSQDISQLPDKLTSLFLRRKAELDATIKDRDAAAETLRVAESKMAAAKAKEMEMAAKAEVINRHVNLSEEKMKQANEMLKAIETREKLVAGRERRVESSEEEQALDELNHGANAALEDEADAAAAEAREIKASSTIPNTGFATAVPNAIFPPSLESTCNTHPARQPVLPGSMDTAIAAKEQELYHREYTLAFRETNLHHRETALFARERLLEYMTLAQIQLVGNWKAQVEISYAGVEAERGDLEGKFRALNGLMGRVEERLVMVRGLVGEARGVMGRGGEDAGESRDGVED